MIYRTVFLFRHFLSVPRDRHIIRQNTISSTLIYYLFISIKKVFLHNTLSMIYTSYVKGLRAYEETIYMALRFILQLRRIKMPGSPKYFVSSIPESYARLRYTILHYACYQRTNNAASDLAIHFYGQRAINNYQT